MKIGERGQVTIPKQFRERFALHASTEVEFLERGGDLVMRKKQGIHQGRRETIESCVGVLGGVPEDVDAFIEDIRGR